MLCLPKQKRFPSRSRYPAGTSTSTNVRLTEDRAGGCAIPSVGRRQTTEHAHAGHAGRGRVLSNANRNPMGCGSVLIHSAERKVRIHRSPARSLRTISSEAAKPPLPFFQTARPDFTSPIRHFTGSMVRHLQPRRSRANLRPPSRSASAIDCSKTRTLWKIVIIFCHFAATWSWANVRERAAILRSEIHGHKSHSCSDPQC